MRSEVQTAARGRRAGGSSTCTAVLPVRYSARTAALSAARSVALTRVRVAAVTGFPAAAVLAGDGGEHRLDLTGGQLGQQEPAQVRGQVEADVAGVALGKASKVTASLAARRLARGHPYRIRADFISGRDTTAHRKLELPAVGQAH